MKLRPIGLAEGSPQDPCFLLRKGKLLRVAGELFDVPTGCFLKGTALGPFRGTEIFEHFYLLGVLFLVGVLLVNGDFLDSEGTVCCEFVPGVQRADAFTGPEDP